MLLHLLPCLFKFGPGLTVRSFKSTGAKCRALRQGFNPCDKGRITARRQSKVPDTFVSTELLLLIALENLVNPDFIVSRHSDVLAVG